jgi:signal transduction histidine kinase
MRRRLDRVAQADPRLVDAVLAVAVIAALELTGWLSAGVSTQDRAVTTAAAVLCAAPIAVRRRWPAGALVFSMCVVLVSMPFGGQLLSNDNAYVLPPLLLSYSDGAAPDALRSTVGLVVALGLGWAWALLPGPDGSTTGAGQSAVAMFYVVMPLVPTWLIGRYARRHRQRTSSFHALAARVAVEEDSRSAAAIVAERARIGSELQDIIAHSISAMVIQAGSARLLLHTDPEQARNSILTVEETGRQALSDLRRLLGMLRKDDDPRALSPQPGLGQIAALIDSLHGTGLACERCTIGDPVALTPGIDLVAYRVIEAALHAAAAEHAHHSSITITYDPRELGLEIRGDRAIDNLDDTFAPLRHRVDLYRGELRAAAITGGFALRARLPLDLAGVA